ncbi:protein CMSS1 isoform X1 [Amborella trichopoda]|uniref:Uncharacterized protein n=1 Tax=Amborella trichopoda TaxID=13333 RepID=W1NWR9_AMBTC|nr:protein CMSS1 isoform X1 [Amborella trichopoda]ERM99710.1 hypothetical protein AMTR_s00099p00087020 [Amborella trichopoda]|eukprot:XP_006836857.1 protein CMSS1 isoform X1 [Amborella trichopoda]
MVRGKQSGPKQKKHKGHKRPPAKVTTTPFKTRPSKPKSKPKTSKPKPKSKPKPELESASLDAKKPESRRDHRDIPPPESSPSQKLEWFFDRFQAAIGFKLSSIELEGITDAAIVELPQNLDRSVDNLSKHVKAIFGTSWKDVLHGGDLLEGRADAGCPALLMISASALRSLELLRGVRPLTEECPAAKLFAKHIKVEDQVSLLKKRVNIASGTPSRIKKLIDIDALGLTRLSVLMLDTHLDAKGYSLFSLPQVSGEFWDLYRTHFHQRVLGGELRLCFY